MLRKINSTRYFSLIILLISFLFAQEEKISIEFGGHDILEMPEAFKQQSYVDQDYYENVIENVKGGNQLSRMGEYAKALERFKSALGYDSTYAFAHNALANTYLKLDSAHQAEKHFKKAIRHGPTYAFAYNNLANLYLNQNKVDAAYELLKRASKIDPNSAYINYNLGNIYFLRNKFSSAIHYYKKAIAQDEEMCEARYNLAISYKRKNMSTLMLKEYEDLINICPGHKKGVLNLAALYLLSGKNDEALMLYRQALVVNPDTELFLALGHAYHNLAYASREIEAYSSAVEADSSNMKAWKFLATAFYEQDMIISSINTCKKALEFDPENEEINQLLVVLTEDR